jgi:hypothetical protein
MNRRSPCITDTLGQTSSSFLENKDDLFLTSRGSATIDGACSYGTREFNVPKNPYSLFCDDMFSIDGNSAHVISD